MRKSLRRVVLLASAVTMGIGLITLQGHADSDETCFTVDDAMLTGAFTGPLDTAGTLKGAGMLNGSTSFAGDASAPSAGLPDDLVAPETASYTGVLTITSQHGTLTLRDVGIFDTDVAGGDGEFASRARVLSGTDRFANAEESCSSPATPTTTSRSPPRQEARSARRNSLPVVPERQCGMAAVELKTSWLFQQPQCFQATQ